MRHLVRARLSILGLAAAIACQSQSHHEFLAEAWNRYRHAYVHPDGYVLDLTRNGGEVTSEGQAYALLRAAWSDDDQTFARVLAWTDRHLRRPDGLLSWRWSPTDGGRVLDANTATDGDEDLAFALIIAAVRFDRPAYLQRAAETVRAIRTLTRLDVRDGWYPSAGNWATASRVVNLSYFTPYAHPYFEALDPEGAWEAATRGGYGLLEAAVQDGRRLPPDFMTVAPDGTLSAPADPNLGRTFSFDAVRTYWRVALDCRLHGRACEHPMHESLIAILRRDGRLATEHAVDGTALTSRESPTFYACVLPMLGARAPDLAARIQRTRLSPRAMRALLNRRDRYYDLNWIWFGVALHSGFIVGRTPSLVTVQAMVAEAGGVGQRR